MNHSHLNSKLDVRKSLSLLLWSPFMAAETIRLHHLNTDEITKYQEKSLKKIVKHSYENVWYYNQLFKKAQITPDDIKTISDLTKIPVTEKKDIRDLPLNKICATNYDLNDCLTYPTSGTSGVPLINPYEKKAKLKQFIKFFLTQMDCGVKVTDRQVVIGADWTTGTSIQRIFRTFSTTRLNPINKPEELVRQIQELNPRVMVSYPSIARIIAKEIIENEITDINIRKIFLGGENLDPYMKKYIGDTYGADVFDAYGANEVGGVSTECPQHSGYHIWGDSVIVEVLKDGEQAPAGEDGEITVTNLTNYMNPFIRYNCKDLGRLKPGECPCGNHYPLMEIIQGRASDLIYLPDGTVISALSIFGPIETTPGVKQFQIIQETTEKIIIKIIKEKKYTPEKIINHINAELGKSLGKVDIKVEIVEDIPKQATGKLTTFISHINKN